MRVHSVDTAKQHWTKRCDSGAYLADSAALLRHTKSAPPPHIMPADADATAATSSATSAQQGGSLQSLAAAHPLAQPSSEPDDQTSESDGDDPTDTANFIDLVKTHKQSRALRVLAKRALDPNAVDPANQWTLLHYAAYYGSEKVAAALIEAGTNVNAVNQHGEAPAMLASKWPHERVVEALLKAGANPNILNKRGRTAVHTASLFARRGALELLVAAGACCSHALCTLSTLLAMPGTTAAPAMPGRKVQPRAEGPARFPVLIWRARWRAWRVDRRRVQPCGASTAHSCSSSPSSAAARLSAVSEQGKSKTSGPIGANPAVCAVRAAQVLTCPFKTWMATQPCTWPPGTPRRTPLTSQGCCCAPRPQWTWSTSRVSGHLMQSRTYRCVLTKTHGKGDAVGMLLLQCFGDVHGALQDQLPSPRRSHPRAPCV